jgi:hypothetical protein
MSDDKPTHTADELRKEAEAQERHARDMAKAGMGGDCPKRTAVLLRAMANAMDACDLYKPEVERLIKALFPAHEIIKQTCDLKLGDRYGDYAADAIIKLDARVKVLEEGIRDVAELIDNSAGVYGLHLNGEPSPWVSLMTGGRDEEWLLKFNKARAALEKKP